MAQNVRINVAGQEFNFSCPTPEHEQLYRLAAKEVDSRLADFHLRYPETSESGKLVLLALQETVGKMKAMRERAALEKGVAELEDELESYLVKNEIKY